VNRRRGPSLPARLYPVVVLNEFRSIESIDPRSVRRFVEYRYSRGLVLYGESRKPLLPSAG